MLQTHVHGPYFVVTNECVTIDIFQRIMTQYSVESHDQEIKRNI